MAKTKVSPQQQTSEIAYAQVLTGNASFVGNSTANDITALTITINVVAGQTIFIEGYLPQIYSNVAGDRADFMIREGSTAISIAYGRVDTGANGWGGANVKLRIQPTAGSHTYKLSIARGSGTGTLAYYCAGDAPGFIQARIV